MNQDIEIRTDTAVDDDTEAHGQGGFYASNVNESVEDDTEAHSQSGYLSSNVNENVEDDTEAHSQAGVIGVDDIGPVI